MAKHFVRLVFNVWTWFLQHSGAPSSMVSEVKGWEGPVVSHWQIAWIATLVLVGLLNMYLVVLVSDMVLKQIPEETLIRQRTA